MVLGLAYLTDIMIMLFIHLTHHQVLPIISQRQLDSSFTILLYSARNEAGYSKHLWWQACCPSHTCMHAHAHTLDQIMVVYYISVPLTRSLSTPFIVILFATKYTRQTNVVIHQIFLCSLRFSWNSFLGRFESPGIAVTELYTPWILICFYFCLKFIIRCKFLSNSKGHRLLYQIASCLFCLIEHCHAGDQQWSITDQHGNDCKHYTVLYY